MTWSPWKATHQHFPSHFLLLHCWTLAGAPGLLFYAYLKLHTLLPQLAIVYLPSNWLLPEHWKPRVSVLSTRKLLFSALKDVNTSFIAIQMILQVHIANSLLEKLSLCEWVSMSDWWAAAFNACLCSSLTRCLAITNGLNFTPAV